MGLTSVLDTQSHRPYPLPSGPWVMTQWWRELLFAHWPIPAASIAPLLPTTLEPDLFDGTAWVAVVPFRMTGVRIRYTPALPWFSNFAELNVRTYVRPRAGSQDKPGVYFWSLEASNPVAVAVARSAFHLPYMNATMSIRVEDDAVRYASRRTHRDAPPADFQARYRPLDATRKTDLVRWLTERYCLYTTDPSGQLYRGDIHHIEWPLYDAEAQIETNTMAQAAGIELPDQPPLLHFSPAIQVAIWPLRPHA